MNNLDIMPQQTDQKVLQKLGILDISGPDAAKFLQGQLSCDMTKITPGTSAIGTHCNPQGRIISLFYVVNIEQRFYLLMPVSLIPVTINALGKYAKFFKTQLRDASSDYQILTGFPPEQTVASITIPGRAKRKIYLVPTSNAQQTLPPDHEWEILNILENIPNIYPETSGKFLPHDLNLPDLGAIDFDKGCYTGQEIIARMHYRGKPKNHLYQGYAAETLSPGSDLYASGKPAGTIIDCSQTMYNNHYPLLLTSDVHTVATQQLQSESGAVIHIQK